MQPDILRRFNAAELDPLLSPQRAEQLRRLLETLAAHRREELDRTTLNDLAELRGITPGTIRRHLAELIRLDLITVKPNQGPGLPTLSIVILWGKIVAQHNERHRREHPPTRAHE